MRLFLITVLISAGLIMPQQTQAQATTPVVLELFTSQGCSSCPPADALLQKLAQDPQVLALSFHVDYWDYLGWRDPFSLPESTQRQHVYAKSLKQNGVYTPELVIDGTRGVVGSQQATVLDTVKTAEQQPKPVTVTLTAIPDHKLNVALSNTTPGSFQTADVWLVTFSPAAVTAVRGGENSGHSLTSINNVKSIQSIGQATNTDSQQFIATLSGTATDSYAVLVQVPNGGKIIGASVYQPTQTNS